MTAKAGRPVGTRRHEGLARERDAGFMLLEVIGALVIGMLALGVLYRGALDGLLLARTADRYQEAVSRARSHLEEACSVAETGGVESMVTDGDDGSGFHWRLQIRPAGQTVVFTKNLESDPRVPPPVNLKLYAVSVAVSRSGTEHPLNVELDSTCLGATPAASH